MTYTGARPRPIEPAVIVIAKTPVPGRVKTRMCPPLTHREAATLAGAALHDTLDTALSTGARVVLALDGAARDVVLDRRIVVIRQRGRGLDERIASAFVAVGRAALLIGMDTPQLTSTQLCSALDTLAANDAVLGPAGDGGYWAVGVQRPERALFCGVPMSTPLTARAQLARLLAHGRRVAMLHWLWDFDDIASARLVAGAVPADSRFARAFATIACNHDPAGAAPLGST